MFRRNGFGVVGPERAKDPTFEKNGASAVQIPPFRGGILEEGSSWKTTVPTPWT